MKKVYLFLVWVMLAASCGETSRETSGSVAEIEPAIETLLNNWHAAASEANYQAYFDAMERESVFIGTDATEVWSKSEFAEFSKPYFEKGKAWDFKVLDRNVYLSKSAEVVWFDEILDTWMGPCRGSGVLEKDAGSWKIKHYVLSMTIPNEDIDAVIKAKSEGDSLFLRKFQEKITTKR